MLDRSDLRVIPSFEPDADVVERLEEVLERARTGDISMVAIATVERGGDASWCFSYLSNTSAMLGAIERMKQRIIRKTDGE